MSVIRMKTKNAEAEVKAHPFLTSLIAYLFIAVMIMFGIAALLGASAIAKYAWTYLNG